MRIVKGNFVSNLSILERLESTLADYAQGAVTRASFVDFLSNSIRALEGVPLSVTHELRQHEYAIETEGYFYDEGFESQEELAKESLLAWIHDLKQTYGT